MNSKSKKVIIAVVILLAIALISLLSVTLAYLSSRRKAEGYLNFASGLAIKYENINNSGNAQDFGNLLHFVDADSDGEIDDGEFQALSLTDIRPSKSIRIANPKLTPKEGTAPFALRAKLVLTDMSDSKNPVRYDTKAGVEELLSGSNPLLLSGDLNFGQLWEYNPDDHYYYFAAAGTNPVLERLIEISYDTQSGVQQEVYLFEGDPVNENLVTITIIDGEPIEEIPVKSLKIELYIEAIEYLSIANWQA